MPFRKKRKRLTEKMIHKQIRSLVPESQAYIELLRLEQKLDTVLMRKRLDIQETLKRPQKVFAFAKKEELCHMFFVEFRSRRNYVSSSAINILCASIRKLRAPKTNKSNIGKCVSKAAFSMMYVIHSIQSVKTSNDSFSPMRINTIKAKQNGSSRRSSAV